MNIIDESKPRGWKKHTDGCCHKTVIERCPECPFKPNKKLTFDEWSDLYSEDVENIDFHYASEIWRLMELAWNAGQENK